MMTPTEEHYERLLAETCREREKYNGMHQVAVMEIERLRDALERVISECERVDSMAPCWASVVYAKSVLARVHR